jgi:hypothetical protein
MFSNPLTSLFGVLAIASKILTLIKPQYAAVLDEITESLLGSGLVAAADSRKVKSAALRSLCWLLGLGLLFAALAGPAAAQTVVVDLHKASLAWDWAKATVPPYDGDADGFTAKCGRQSGVYNIQTPINDPAARSAPIRSVVNGQGQWFCVVGAFNRYGPSPATTNEVSFDAGAVPAGPTKARVQAQ